MPTDDFEFRLDAKVTRVTERQMLDSLVHSPAAAATGPLPQRSTIVGATRSVTPGQSRSDSGAGAAL